MTFTLPDVRRDRDRHLAQLFRDICYLDSCEGSFASNGWFERQLGVVDSTVKRLLRVLVECGLVEVEVLQGNQRRIRPLATLAEALASGWKALCRAVLDRQKLPAALRRLAASQLRRSGCNLARLGLSRPQKCAPPAPRIAPPSPEKKREAWKTTTSVAVPPAEAREPQPEAVAVAVSAGLTEQAARSAVREKPLESVRGAIAAVRAYAARHEVRSLPALLFTAIRSGWLPPAPPPCHPSDLGERPQRVVKARRAIPPDWLPGVDYELARALCNEAAQTLRALGSANPTDAEIRNMARLLWERQHPKEVPPWSV
jgi:DNA-binding transcriptional ArsR family regulator